LAGAPQKIGGSPLFPKKGGHRPPLFTLRPTFEEKKEFPGIFQKKTSRKNLKMCSRQSLQYNNTDRNTKIQQIDTKQNTDTKKTAGNTVV
jgi:hypothetical protein